MTSPTPIPDIEIGDRKAALGWIRRSRLPPPTQRALARFVRRFGDATFYRELPAHHDRVEALLGRRLPRWYRRLRSALAFVFPGEEKEVRLAGGPEGRYRFDLCGADLRFLEDRPRNPAIPLADDWDRGTLGLRASGRGVWIAWTRLQRRWAGKPRRMERAYPGYLALLDDVDRVQLADGRILWGQTRRAETWHQRGVVALEFGEVEEAIALLSRAVALDPRRWGAWYRLGTAHGRKAQRAEARAAFERCAEGFAEDPRGYWGEIGAALSRLDRHAESLEALDEAAARGPMTAFLHFYRGVALHALGRRDEALDAFLRATALDPESETGWMNAGFLEHHRGNYAAAVDLYDQGLEHSPESPGLVFNRACAYAMLGDRQMALWDLEEAIKLRPKYASEAREDDAFASLRADPAFVALTGG